MSAASLRRAAIVLASLSRPAADRLLLQMTTDQARRVRRMMRELGDVDATERQRAITAFLRRQGPPVLPGGEAEPPAPRVDPLAAPTNPAGGADPGKPPLTAPPPQPLATDSLPNLPLLDGVPDTVLLRAMAGEHPQTIALVLAALPSPQASRLLGALDPQRRGEVVRRLARMEEIPPDALEHVSEHLRGLLAELDEPPASAVGSRTLAAILEHLEPGGQDDVVAEVRRAIPNVAARASARETPSAASPPAEDASVAPSAAPQPATGQGSPSAEPVDPPSDASARDAALADYSADDRTADDRTAERAEPAISFDQLQRLPTEALRAALAEVDSEIAVVALCGARPAVTEALLASLPRRQARLVRRRLDQPGPLPLSDIDLAQRIVAEAASELDDQGRLPRRDLRALAAA